jgi:hypothetical protein
VEKDKISKKTGRGKAKSVEIDPRKLSIPALVKIYPALQNTEKPLTQRQIKFIVCYVENGLNGPAAYAEAGYKPVTGKNRTKTIAKRVSQYLNKPGVQEALGGYIKARAARDQIINEKKLLDSLTRRAFYDTTIFYTSAGNFKPLNEIPREYHCVIDSISQKPGSKDDETTQLTYKLADKDKAMEKLLKYTNLGKNETVTNLIISKETEDKLQSILGN